MVDESSSPARGRVVRAVARALGLVGTETPSLMRLGTTPGWDSLGHMTVVLEIEKEFGIRVPISDISDLVDVESILRFVGSQER